jgi:YidC/Oxa1 family membrane protein insertase
LGPNYYDKLKEVDTVAGRATHFGSVIDFGWFGFIGKPLQWLLKAIHGVFGSWGIAIILLTVVVKLATGYWTLKQLRGANLMRAVQPKIKEMQERYKGDRQRQQQEQMAINKQYGVNPLAGCLPMALQMPIWIALYRMLSSAGELYLQPFLWIKDLTNTDPYHILPVILTAAQFLQMRMMPAAGTDPLQQKIMTYMMPIVFGGMSLFFPAGLTLYIFTNTTLSVLMSLYVNKYDKTNAAAVENVKQKMAAEGAVAKTSIEDLKKSADAKGKSAKSDTGGDAANTDGTAGNGGAKGGNKGKKRR